MEKKVIKAGKQKELRKQMMKAIKSRLSPHLAVTGNVV
jgi:hypothetical protein